MKSVAAVSEPIPPIVWKISGVVLLGPLMTSLDSTVVNVSLSTLSQNLHAPLTVIQWVTSGYLLALALILPMSGWLVDRLGARRVYLVCFTLFTLASLLCGMAQTAGQLIVCRVLQGMVGGLLAPMAQMMTARVAGRQMARIFGYLAVPVLIGPILGPVLAGAILQNASWRWIFFINLPIGIIATGLAARILPPDDDQRTVRTFDMVGFLLLSPGLVLLLNGLESLGQVAVSPALNLGMLVLSAILLGSFLRYSLVQKERCLIDVELFRIPTFAAAACTQFLSNSLVFGGQLLLPLYLITVLGESPSHTGWLLAPAGLGLLCAFPMMGNLTERFGPRTVCTTGAVIALLGLLPFALFGASGLPLWLVCLALFVRGTGQGCIGVPSIASAYAAVPKETIPIATTALNIVQRLGGPTATTLLALFLHLRTHASTRQHAFVETFWLLCALHALTAVSALRLPSRVHPRPSAPEVIDPSGDTPKPIEVASCR